MVKRILGTILVLFAVFTAGCTEAQPPVESSTEASAPSREATATLKGWFVLGGSQKPAHPNADGTIGSFTVRLTDDEAKGDQGTQRFEVTPGTQLDVDVFDQETAEGRWLWVDYRSVGDRLEAVRVYAPVGIAY